MTKRINKKLLVGLGLSGAAVILLIGVAMIRSLRPTDPTLFLELAGRAASSGEYRRAAGLYARAAGISRRADHLTFAGDMWLRDGNIEMARSTWEAAKTLDPSAILPRERQLGLMLEFSRLTNSTRGWQEVLTEADGLLRIEPNHAGAHHARGVSLYFESKRDPGKTSEALAELRKAAAADASNVDYTVDLADALDEQGAWDEAESLLRELAARVVQPVADAVKARCRLGALLARRRQWDEALVTFRDAVALASGNPDAVATALLSLARCHVIRGGEGSTAPGDDTEITEALRCLEEAIRQSPETFDAVVEKSRLLMRLGRYDEARTICDQRIARGFPDTGLRRYERIARLYELNLSAAEACLAAARQASLPTAQRNKLLTDAMTYVHAAQREWQEGPRGMALEGEILLLQGYERQALERLTRADQRYAETGRIDWRLRIMLSRLHLALDEPGAALDAIIKLRETAERQRPDDATYWSTLSQVLAHNERWEEALEAADRALNLRSDDEMARRAKLAALAALKRMDEVRRLSREWSGSESATLATVLTDARLAALQGDLPTAATILKQHLQQAPDDGPALREAVSILLRMGRRDEAYELVQSALQRKPDIPDLRRLAVSVDPNLSAQQRDEAMLDLIREEPDPLLRGLQLAGFHFYRGNYERVLSAIDEAETALNISGATDAPGRRVQIQAMLARYRLFAGIKAKDWTAAQRAVAQAAELNLDGAEGQVFRGEYHLLRDEVDQAYPLLRAAVEAQPTYVPLLVMLASCCERLGRTQDAKSLYQRAVASNPASAVAQRGLAMTALRLNDEATYVKALAACEKMIPTDPWVADQLLRRDEEKNPAQALERRKKVLETRPDDVENLLEMARLSQRLARIADADRYFDQAMKIRPDDQEVVFKSAHHRLFTGRAKEGEDIIRAYIDRQTSPEGRAAAMLTLAGFHMQAQRRDDARRTLEQAAEISPTLDVCLGLADFFLLFSDDPVSAIPWYDKALAAATRERSPRWGEIVVRRVTCALHPRVGDLAGARQLVEEARASAVNRPEWLYWSAEIESAKGRTTQAIELFTRFLEAQPGDVTALFQRAHQYMVLGNWSAAIADLQAVKAAVPDALDLRPRFLLAFAYECSGRKEDALRELETLFAQFPASEHAARELMYAYMRLGRRADAERIATAQVNRYNDARAVPWLQLRAEIARRGGDHGRALQDDLRVAELTNHATAEVARVLISFGRAGRIRDGIVYYETYAAPGAPGPWARMQYAQLLSAEQRWDDAAREAVGALNAALSESFASVLRVLRAIANTFGEEHRARLDAAVSAGETPDLLKVLIQCGWDEARGDWKAAAAGLTRLYDQTADVSLRLTLLRCGAMILHSHGDPPAAAATYRLIIEAAPDDVISLNNLANLLMDPLNQPQEAEAYARRAVVAAKDDGSLAETLDTLGWILVRKGQRDEGIQMLSRALQLSPERPSFLLHMGEAMRRSSCFVEAGALLRSGRIFAERTGDAELVARFDASLERCQKQDPGE